MNRKLFYDNIRVSLFAGKLSPTQVAGIELILNEWDARKLTDLRWLSYILATIHHEVGQTYEPIEENLNYSASGLLKTWPSRFTPEKAAQYAKKPQAIANYVYSNRIGNGPESSGDGWKYRGRGLIQTTGRSNYEWAKKMTGIDLIANPDLMKTMDVSIKTSFSGMINGLYTGKKLSDYFSGQKEDWINARKIINNLDKAEKIAEYGKKFFVALKSA